MEKIKAKINKLLRLAMSSNEHEAKLAMEKAMELRAKHGLSKEEVLGEKLVYESIEVKYAKVPSWLLLLANKISEFSGCYVVITSGKSRKVRNKNYKRLSKKAKVFISGQERDVKNVEYLLVFYYREISSRKGSLSYKMGLVFGLLNILEKMKDSFFGSEEKILIAIEFMQKRFDIDTKRVKPRVGNGRDFNRGFEDGEEIIPRNGVNEKPKELEWRN